MVFFPKLLLFTNPIAIRMIEKKINGENGYPRIAYLSYLGMFLVLRQYAVQIRKTNTLLPLFLPPPRKTFINT